MGQNLCIVFEAFSPRSPNGIDEIRYPHPGQIYNMYSSSSKYPIAQWKSYFHNKESTGQADWDI
jgi:hypothetical protein